ncbi:hypothetical protein DNL40_02635 [Xylanimonas oleitrophica]|uniref:Uncharacterized protein n=1 Tax=Xylanimonas oleitrophica TaxID=2607479 RepID=A0A2W5X2Y1_9MICO|nr:hypothetical protein [Xylanimonas oleitrophica]PZR55286.1 hypothetical protein DNL40_02635 [Xylanimonas oleitrophica]
MAERVERLTNDEVRRAFISARRWVDGTRWRGMEEEDGARFDRWLAQVEAEAEARGAREAIAKVLAEQITSGGIRSAVVPVAAIEAVADR